MKKRKLRRSSDQIYIGGVCAGLAYFIGIKVITVRFFFAGASLCFGAGIVAYLILWSTLHPWNRDPVDFEEVTT